jgi:EmrB/QacA subfamily drug resistance transporter
MTTTETDTGRDRWIALLILCAGTLMIVLDQTIVNVALPTIQHDLDFSAPDLAWVVDAYLLAFGGLLLLAGRIGDLVGRRRVFLTGLVVFTLASVLCGAAASPGVLIGARFFQGIGGALTAAVILGMVVTLFPEPAEQARAIGVFSFVQAAGGSLGLLAGGLLTELISWHWIFFVNVPIGIAATLAAASRVRPDAGIGLHAGADLPGALLAVAAPMLAVYTIVEAGRRGWTSAATLGLGGLALVLLAGFVVRQARASTPLVPLRIFRAGTPVIANAGQALAAGGLFTMMFVGALYLQRVLGFGAIAVGLAFLPVAAVIALFSLAVTARLIEHIGARATLVSGLGLIAVGLVLLARAPVDGRYVIHVLPAMLALGIGGGLALPTLMSLAMEGAAPDEAGLASGLASATQQVGGALGLSVLVTLASGRTGATADPAALLAGYHLAFGAAAGLVLAALAIAAAGLRPARRRVAGRRAAPCAT